MLTRLNTITTTLLMCLLILGVSKSVHAVPFRDALEYGNTASMIGIGKIEGYTPHAGVVFENAAALTDAASGLSMFYQSAMDDAVTALSGAYSYHISPKLTVGVGIANESTTGLDKTAESGGQAVSIDTFDYTNTAYITGMGYTVSDVLSLGATLTHYDKQVYTAHGQGNALGLSAHVDLHDTDIFMKIKNLGSPDMRYNQGDHEVLQAEYGIAVGHHKSFSETLSATLMGQLKMSDQLPTLYSAGLKVYPFKNVMAFGVGYQESRGVGAQVKGGLTFGVDLSVSNITFSYAYQATQYAAQSQAHHFSVFFGF